MSTLNATFPCLMVIFAKGEELDNPQYVHLHNEDDARRMYARFEEKHKANGWHCTAVVHYYSTEYTATAEEHHADVDACLAEPNSSAAEPKPGTTVRAGFTPPAVGAYTLRLDEKGNTVGLDDAPGIREWEQSCAAAMADEEDHLIAAKVKEVLKARGDLLAYEQAGAMPDNAPKLTASAADTNAHPTESTENMKNTTTVMSTELVPFHGSMFEAGKADDKVWVSVRRMCEPLELAFNGQFEKLSSGDRAPWAVVRVMRMTGPDGKTYETFCLELDCVPMWLATLDSSRVAPHLREKIVLFQKEATKALRDHFFKAPKPAPPPTRAEIARMLLIECERAEKLEAEKQVLEHTVDTLVAEVEAVDARNAELEPIVATHKELVDANGLSSMTQVAMSIKEGLQRLYQWLREDGFIQPSPSCLPYQQHIDNGLFDLICVPYQKKDKKGVMVDHVRYVTHATAKGLTVLAARYRRGGTHSRWDKPMKRTKKVKSVPTL